MTRTGRMYDRKVILLIIIFLILRSITASILELGNDEAYYWLYSRQLQWNYFDHPPMVAVWVRFFTLNGWLDHYEGIVRAGSVISCGFSTWFLYKAVSLIQDQRAGWFAACLLNASLYAGLVAGVLIMPDSPQLFFWTLCLWQIAKLVHNDRRWINWLIFGASAGLCVMSKVHGLFLWTGLAAFILFKKREWLKLPQLYVSLFLSLAIMSPIFFWNLRYDFITWRFHSERIAIHQPAPGKESFWFEFFSQVVLNNPFNFLLIILALIFFRKKPGIHPALSIYNFIALPLAIILIFISLFRDIWYHWSGPAYTTLLPLAAVRLSQLNTKTLFPAPIKWSLGFCLLSWTVWPLFTLYYPGTYGSKNERTLGKGDITLDKYGWRDAGESFAALYKEEIREGVVSPRAPIVCPSWWGAHLEYYFGKPADAPVIGLGDVAMLRQYTWLNEKRMAEADMDTAYCIVASVEDTASANLYARYYREKIPVTTMKIFRNGEPVANFYIHKLTGWKGNQENLDDISAVR